MQFYSEHHFRLNFMSDCDHFYSLEEKHQRLSLVDSVIKNEKKVALDQYASLSQAFPLLFLKPCSPNAVGFVPGALVYKLRERDANMEKVPA